MKKTDKVSHEIHGTGTIIDTHLGLGFAYVEFGFDSIWVKFEELTALSAASEVEGEVMYKAGDWVVTDKGKVRQIDHILAVPVGHNCTVALKGEMYPTNSTRWKYFQASFLNRYVPSVGEYVVIESNISDTGVNGCNDQPFHYVGRLGKVTAIEDTERYPNSKWISIDNHFAAITSNQLRPATDAEIAAAKGEKPVELNTQVRILDNRQLSAHEIGDWGIINKYEPHRAYPYHIRGNLASTWYGREHFETYDEVKSRERALPELSEHVPADHIKPTLIPFDLEKATKESVRNGAGEKPDEYYWLTSENKGIYKIHGNWTEIDVNGRSPMGDLFLAPEEKVVYRNIYKDTYISNALDSIDLCKIQSRPKPLCVLQFTTIGDRTTVTIAHTY